MDRILDVRKTLQPWAERLASVIFGLNCRLASPASRAVLRGRRTRSAPSTLDHAVTHLSSGAYEDERTVQALARPR